MSSQQNGRVVGNPNGVGRPEEVVQNLHKEVAVARELAILGDYDTALTKF
jgi:hypothetical protein